MRVVVSAHAPDAIGPYVHGIEAAGLLFVSGQLPIRPDTGQLVVGIEDEVRQALHNALAVVVDAGSQPTDVVKATLFLTDLAEFPTDNRIYEEVFGGWKPARSVVGVQALPRGAHVEVELVAAVYGHDPRLPVRVDA